MFLILLHTFWFWSTFTLNASSRFWWQKSIWTKYPASLYYLALYRNIATFKDIVRSNHLSHIANSFKNYPLPFSFKVKNNTDLTIHNVFNTFRSLLVLVYIHIERFIQVLLAEIHMHKLSCIALFHCTLTKKRKQELA